MKSLIRILLLMLFVLIIMSCTEDPDPDENVIFPLVIGNRWSYQEIERFYNFDPPSLAEEFPDSTLDYSYQEILRTEILYDTLETYVIASYINERFLHSEEYYCNESNGFFRQAYEYFGKRDKIPRNGSKLLFEGKYFTNMQEIIFYIRNEIKNVRLFNYDDPPRKYIEYPLENGLQWTVYENEHQRVDRKVICFETIEVPAGLFSCCKMEVLFFDNTNGYRVDTQTFHYFSSIGLIKTITSVKNIQYIDEYEGPLGYFDYSIESNLSSYSVN